MINTKINLNNSVNVLLASVLVIILLYWGQTLFIPMFYGLFIAIVLYPVCKWLEEHRFSKTLAVTLSLFIILILFAGLILILILQFNSFLSDLPELKVKLNPSVTEFQNWLYVNFNISSETQNNWWRSASENLTGNSTGLMAAVFTKTVAGLFSLFLIPVFAALFLYNRNDFVLFLEKLAGNLNSTKLHKILNDAIHTYFHFIKGMILVYIIVGILNSIGLLALGIKHAILFGFLTAIMTIIPYVGIVVSALLPVTMAWLTKDSIWYPVGVVMVFVFVQYLEANIIFPRVVATQLNISTWATLVAIIAGGILWGVSGMILFIPFAGMLKLVTDNVPEWEAINVLLRRRK